MTDRIFCEKCRFTVSRDAALACLALNCPARTSFRQEFQHETPMRKERGFAIPLPIVAFFAKWGVWILLLAAVIFVSTVAVKRYNEGLRAEGRAEIQSKWDADKRARDIKTAELVGQARAEERANQVAVNQAKDRADAEIRKLRDDIAAFNNSPAGKLRVNRAGLCKPSVPGAASSGSGNTKAAGNETLGAGSGEINLDDVAREIGRLGGDLDTANIRIAELIGIVNVCQRRNP